MGQNLLTETSQKHQALHYYCRLCLITKENTRQEYQGNNHHVKKSCWRDKSNAKFILTMTHTYDDKGR